jgi:glycosyltransferase involved in cell wall biosynthesis
MEKKIKVLTLGDNPIAASGVAHVTRDIVMALLDSKKFEVISLGGAHKHADYKPIKIEEYKDDWTIIPVNGFGNHDIVRTIIRNEKPDIVWIMTDPRYWEWLWMIENEIRPLAPLVYYHVWDNLPYPKYNKVFYESCDRILTISKLTDDVVRTVAPSVPTEYLPHCVNPEIYKVYDEIEIGKFKKEFFGVHQSDFDNRVIYYWNNRNMRRKMAASLIMWYSQFMKTNKLENEVMLVMKTNPKDEAGPDLFAVAKECGLTSKQIRFIPQGLSEYHLAMLYNIADYTINIADSEGFGLSSIESIACGTPVISNMTGGLKDQISLNDGGDCGIPVYPSSKMTIGSQTVPYIYEDRISEEDFIGALYESYARKTDDSEIYAEWCANCSKQIEQNFNFRTIMNRWIEIMEEEYVRTGGFGRPNDIYQRWELKEVTNG